MRIWLVVLLNTIVLVFGWVTDTPSFRESHHHEMTSSHHREMTSSRLLSHDAAIVWECSDTGEWIETSIKNDAAVETWRWCCDFVVPLNLCPWAAASVNTSGALRIYLSEQSEMEDSVLEAAKRLHQDIENNIVDPGVAIAFVVCSDRDWEFSSFYEWFDNLEESFEFEDDFVTLAPFHPDWQFGDGPPELNIEKQSPYPTVTVVCTSVIDNAGAAATEAIVEHNERVLLDMGVSKLRELYQTNVFHKDSPS